MEHPALTRYREARERIAHWYNVGPNCPAMNLAMMGSRIPPPRFDIELAVLMDDMALAIEQLSAVNDWREFGELSRQEMIRSSLSSGAQR